MSSLEQLSDVETTESLKSLIYFLDEAAGEGSASVYVFRSGDLAPVTGLVKLLRGNEVRATFTSHYITVFSGREAAIVDIKEPRNPVVGWCGSLAISADKVLSTASNDSVMVLDLGKDMTSAALYSISEGLFRELGRASLNISYGEGARVLAVGDAGFAVPAYGEDGERVTALFTSSNEGVRAVIVEGFWALSASVSGDYAYLFGRGEVAVVDLRRGSLVSVLGIGG